MRGERLAAVWRTLVTTDPELGRAYLLHLVERVEVEEARIVVMARSTRQNAAGGRNEAHRVGEASA